MNSYSVGKINIQANHENPALVIVADAPSMQGFNAGLCMTPKQMARLFEMLGSAIDDGVAIISPCDPIPEAIAENNRLVMEHLTASAADFQEALGYYQPRAVVTLGKIGLSQVAGRSAKIMSERGSFHTYERTGAVPVMPVNSIANLFIRPQIAPIMESDLRQVTAMADNGWEPVVSDNASADYSWCLDLSELLANPPKKLVTDTETLGLNWFNKRSILTVQLCTEEGKAIAVPLNKDYWNNEELRGESSRHLPKLTDAKVNKLVSQIKQLLGNPEVQVCGHKLKFDCHHFRQYGIEVANWKHDTMQLVFTVDENMRLKNLDEATRRWVPAMAGYADKFNNDPIHEKKSRMDKVRHDDMLQYGCGDVDACMRLVTVLVKEAKKDERNYAVYEKVKMPALKHVFLDHAERYGLPLVQTELVKLENALAEKANRLESELLREAAEQWPAVLRRHMDKGCKFSRPDFVRDILFSPDGLNLTPVLATKKTRKLAEEDQLESTSKKDHLPYFEHIPWVAKLIEHQSVATLIKSFTGRQSTEEWAVVKPLKNGGYGKRIVEAFARAGRELPTARPGPVRRRLVQTGDTPPHEPDQRTAFTIGEYTYAVGGSQVFVLVEEEAKGFWHYLETNDPNALHPDFGLSTAVTGRTNCVTGETLIPTKSGLVCAKDIKVGHKVWTHKNRWRKVTYLHTLPDEEVYAVHFSNGEVLRCSERHSLLTESGHWVTIKNVCIEKAFGRQAAKEEGNRLLSRIITDYDAASCGEQANGINRSGDTAAGNTSQGANSLEGVEVFREQDGQQKPDAQKDRQEASQLEGRLCGWERLSDASGRWEPVFRASNRNGEDARHPSVSATEEPGGASHRREPGEQRTGQPGTSQPCRTQGDPSALSISRGGIEITKVEFIGSRPVFDFAVEEDASYEAAGIFSHNCSSPNLQNIPKRGEEAKAFRKIFKAPPGWVFIECDESQAELRVAAAMAKERNMIKVYKAGGDIHAMTGQRVAGLTDAQWAATPKERKKELRQMAKAVNFGYLFGMWWKKFKQYAKTSYGVTVTDREAERSRETYFQLYPGLEKYHQDMRAFANKHKYVRALHGALRRLPDIDSVEEGMRKEAERQAINSPVQGFASDLGLMGATLFADGVDHNIARVLGFIHDATVVMARVEHAPQVASWLRWCMENQPLEQYFGLTLPIPIVADVSMGSNLSEMEEQPNVTPVRPPWVMV